MDPCDWIDYVVRRIRAVKHAASPSRKQSEVVEPPRIQAEDDGGKCLKNPDAAEQLKVDRVLLVQRQDEHERKALNQQRDDLGRIGFFGMRGVGLDPFTIDVASEGVG